MIGLALFGAVVSAHAADATLRVAARTDGAPVAGAEVRLATARQRYRRAWSVRTKLAARWVVLSGEGQWAFTVTAPG